MKTTIDGIEYKITFQHLMKPINDNPFFRPRTLCWLASETTTCKGEAWVHPEDTYCKETGRKLALKRALKVGGFSREQRKLFWVAYRYRVVVDRELGGACPRCGAMSTSGVGRAEAT